MDAGCSGTGYDDQSTKTFCWRPPSARCDRRVRAGRGADALGADPDMGYGYGKDGKTFSYKMGTNNAGMLLKGAKKVPKGTLFFIGQNGQLYMRTGPYLEGDGKFMFGPDVSGCGHFRNLAYVPACGGTTPS